MDVSVVEIVASVFLVAALIHTFSSKYLEHLAHTSPDHQALWHLLAEVEVIFGLWGMAFVAFLAGHDGGSAAIAYLDGLNFTEPAFVLVVMVIAASKPIVSAARALLAGIARLLPVPEPVAFYFSVLAVGPLLGSFITEPAAMTLCALILYGRYYQSGVSESFKYATIAVLFVNVSIGGVLTPYAAPPVLMVAGKWGWGLTHMLSEFGWKAAIATIANAFLATMLVQGELRRAQNGGGKEDKGEAMPLLVTLIHAMFLAAAVAAAHHTVVLIGLFLLFIGFTEAYRRYQDPLVLRGGLMVAFFLSGLVILGGPQKWWLQPLLSHMSSWALFAGATLLTAITDNAALTYLGAQVEGISDASKYALVAGAVTGGGLTVIANAPNPAGFSILRPAFDEGSIAPLRLLLWGLVPTMVAAAAFMVL